LQFSVGIGHQEFAFLSIDFGLSIDIAIELPEQYVKKLKQGNLTARIQTSLPHD
jgi:hypothetical protein